MSNNEETVVCLQQAVLFKTHTPQILGARTFHKFQVVGIVDDAAAVGIFVIYTDSPFEIPQSGTPYRTHVEPNCLKERYASIATT